MDGKRQRASVKMLHHNELNEQEHESRAQHTRQHSSEVSLILTVFLYFILTDNMFNFFVSSCFYNLWHENEISLLWVLVCGPLWVLSFACSPCVKYFSKLGFEIDRTSQNVEIVTTFQNQHRCAHQSELDEWQISTIFIVIFFFLKMQNDIF